MFFMGCILISEDTLYNVSAATGRKKIVRSIDDLLSIFKLYHSSPEGGHSGSKATIEKISRLYYWYKMANDIRHFVRGCFSCVHKLYHCTVLYFQCQHCIYIECNTVLFSPNTLLYITVLCCSIVIFTIFSRYPHAVSVRNMLHSKFKLHPFIPLRSRNPWSWVARNTQVTGLSGVFFDYCRGSLSLARL